MREQGWPPEIAVIRSVPRPQRYETQRYLPESVLEELREWAEAEGDNGAEFPDFDGGWATAMKEVANRIKSLQQRGGVR